MILVVGASGSLGGSIAQALLAQGKPVRILTRNPLACSALVQAGATPVEGDLKDPPSLAQAVTGITTVITTANAAQRGGSDTFESVDLVGNQNLIEAAKAAAVKQFIFTSAFTADADSPDPFMSFKGRTEQTLAGSGMNYTILAPHIFMEVWFGMVIGTALQSGEAVTLVGRGDKRHSFVSAGDVAAVALAAVGNAAAIDRRIPIGGPEAVSWTEVVRRVARVMGRDLPVTYVPIGSPLPIPRATWNLMYATEMFEADISTSEVTEKFGVSLTPLEEVAKRLFPVPT